jgi:hypothetical protein
VEAVLPAPAARELGLNVGDEITLAATADSSRTVTVRVSGTYRIDDPRDVYWWASELETSGSQTVNYTTYGPFVVPEASFYGRVATEAHARWRAALPLAGVSVGGLGALDDRLTALSDRLRSSSTADYTVAGDLQDVLAKADRSLLVARSGVLIPSVQLGILAAAALLFLAGLLAERRTLESAVIRSRGAGKDKVAALAAMEGALLAVPAAVVAPWLAALSLRALNHVGPLAAVDLGLHTEVSRESYVLAFLAAVACVAALAFPALRSAPVVATVSERGRPPFKSFFRRAGLDLALVALALLAYWQLRRYGGPVVETIQGRLGVDPFLIAAPALGLLAGAVLALRVVPAAAAGVERVASAARGVVPALGTRELARRPQRYARAALLLTLALAIGLFASAYSRTWLRSQHDQAAYAAGADLRVRPSERSGSIPAGELASAYRRIEGIRATLPVLTQTVELTRSSGETEVLALDAARTARVADFRSDLADRPLGEMLGPLAKARPRLATVPLPGRPVRIALDVRMRGVVQNNVPIFGSDVRSVLFLVVSDGNGVLYRLPGGSVIGDGTRQRVEFTLGDTLADGTRGMPTYPLALVSIELQMRMPYRHPLSANLTILNVATSESENGPFVQVERPTKRWAVDVPPVQNVEEGPKILGVHSGPRAFYSLDFTTGAWREFFTRASVTFTATPGANPPIRRVPAIVTDEFRDRTATGVGGTVPLAAAGRGLGLSVVGVVHGFPTLVRASGGAIVDLPTFLAASYLADGTIYSPTEWWLDAAEGQDRDVARRLRASPYSSNEVVARVERAESLANDPVALGISGALLFGFVAAAVFAVVGFAVSAAVSAAERATEFAVLRSLGVSAPQLASSLAVEGGLLIALALGVGTALGVGLAWLVLPFASLTAEGIRPYPGVLVVFPWRTAALLEAGLVVALVAVVTVELHVLGRMRLAPALRTGEDR